MTTNPKITDAAVLVGLQTWFGDPSLKLEDFDTDGVDHRERMRRTIAALPHMQQAGGVWRHPDELPPVEQGGAGWFWVAVRRAHNGKVYSFPATYLNRFKFENDDDPVERPSLGNRWSIIPPDESDECYALATGWHDPKEHSEYSAFYESLLQDSDELVAWREVAAFGDTTPAQPEAGVPEGWRITRASSEANRPLDRWEIYDPSGVGGVVSLNDVPDWIVRSLLDALAAAGRGG